MKPGIYRAFDSSTRAPASFTGFVADGIRTEYTYRRGKLFGRVTECISVRLQLQNGDWVDLKATMTAKDHKNFPADIGYMMNNVPGFADSEQLISE